MTATNCSWNGPSWCRSRTLRPEHGTFAARCPQHLRGAQKASQWFAGLLDCARLVDHLTGRTECMTDTRPITSLATLQFAWGGLLDSEPTDFLVHLLRRDDRGGTPGPTLCDIDRFDPVGPGWSVGGGVSGPGIELSACERCVAVAHRDYPGLTVGTCTQPFSGVVVEALAAAHPVAAGDARGVDR